MSKLRIWIIALALFMAVACTREGSESAHEDEHGEHEAAEEFERGPHGGRLLADDDFQIELAIFEAGVEPEFHAWPTLDGKPLSPAEVELAVELHRLGGAVDRIAFAPQGDYLRGDRVVVEPHSFDVRVTARHRGKSHSWEYASHEGRTTIADDVAHAAGIEIAVAGPGTLVETLALYGTIGPDPTRVREVKARFPGVIRAVSKQVGAAVRAGDALATIESNESLRTYTVTASISGIVTRRHAEPGEQTGDTALFELADFSRVVADFNVFPRDRARVRPGQSVRVTTEDGAGADGSISYISPLGDRHSQSVVARVTLDNEAGTWTSGQFVEGRVAVASTPVELAVPLAALQTFRDFTVVYAQVGDVYEVRMLELGRRDATHVEVLSGLSPGTRYVARNSYLIKADIEKSGASHDH